MKVMIINGSPRPKGNTALALEEMSKVFREADIQTEIISIGNKNIRGCIACNSCKKTGVCIFNDEVNEMAGILKEADGLVIASPVYYGSANGTLISALDRLFYSCGCDLSMKVGASVVIARRGGLSSTFDELNKYFTISGMPVASSYYWNSVHGGLPGEASQDKEGMYVVRMLAKNMVFLMKSIALGKQEYGLPTIDKRETTSFIR
ncbi:MAG: flavodoxin family protein [Bacilli bacterium]